MIVSSKNKYPSSMPLFYFPKVLLSLFIVLLWRLTISGCTAFVHSRNGNANSNNNNAQNERENQCSGSCIAEMQALIDSTPFFKSTSPSANGVGNSIVAMAKSFDKAGNGNGEANYTLNLFNKICNAYDNVDTCLGGCERIKDQQQPQQTAFGRDVYESSAKSGRGDIRQAYAGLQFICKEKKSDFFEALPCLAEYEPSAMLKCNREINQSQESTVLFTTAIVNREFQSIALRFSTLCRDLSLMMKCMEPTIRRGCGDRPTNLMLTFIGLEFSSTAEFSFEKLNEQLGFDHPLPSPCRTLIHYSNERRLSSQGVKGRYNGGGSLARDRSNTNGKHNSRKHYSYGPNGVEGRGSWCVSVVLLMGWSIVVVLEGVGELLLSRVLFSCVW